MANMFSLLHLNWFHAKILPWKYLLQRDDELLQWNACLLSFLLYFLVVWSEESLDGCTYNCSRWRGLNSHFYDIPHRFNSFVWPSDSDCQVRNICRLQHCLLLERRNVPCSVHCYRLWHFKLFCAQLHILFTLNCGNSKSLADDDLHIFDMHSDNSMSFLTNKNWQTKRRWNF